MNDFRPLDAPETDGPLPPLAELVASTTVVSVPLAVRFRGVRSREALLFEGPAGWAEFSPFAEYDDPESAHWLAAAIEAAYLAPPPALVESVPVNATIPAVPAADVPNVLARFDGCRTVKVKVAERGQSLDDDVARVQAVRALDPDLAIRVDANGGWTVPAAVEALSRLSEVGLEYAEQPCATVEELLGVREALNRNGIDVQLAADESIRKASDPLRVARSGAVSVAVVKVAPLGGTRRVLAVAGQLAALGVRVVVSSALETSVGLATGVAAAAALPGESLAAGLGTARLLEDDVVHPPLVPVGGRLPVRPIRPLTTNLARLRVGNDRRDWWVRRLTRCYDLLARRSA